MTVDLKKARDFVYENGALWEEALFAYLFQGGSIDTLHQRLLQYKNPDGGYGHGLEHDVHCPDSNPVAVEFLLMMLTQTGVDKGPLLENTGRWVAANQKPDGSLENPPALLDYPHAPWWEEMGGQQEPDAITGLLIRHDSCPTEVLESTRRWVEQNRTLEDIANIDWLFMTYHPFHYFFNVGDYPDVYRDATLEAIRRCSKDVDGAKLADIFMFVTAPESPVAALIPDDLVQKALDYVEGAQQDDGSWQDQHGLPQWYPYTTIISLLTLRRFGRLT